MWKAPFFWQPGVCMYFSLRFFETACSLGIQWIDCDICLTTSNKWIQKIKGQYMNRSIFWMIKYMNGSVFSKARYMNERGSEILTRTPVPQLPPNYTHTPIPTPEIYIFADLFTFSKRIIFNTDLTNHVNDNCIHIEIRVTGLQKSLDFLLDPFCIASSSLLFKYIYI